MRRHDLSRCFARVKTYCPWARVDSTPDNGFVSCLCDKARVLHYNLSMNTEPLYTMPDLEWSTSTEPVTLGRADTGQGALNLGYRIYPIACSNCVGLTLISTGCPVRVISTIRRECRDISCFTPADYNVLRDAANGHYHAVIAEKSGLKLWSPMQAAE